MEKKINYKGFDKDLKCRGFQYRCGETYKLPNGEKPEICSNGFHAIAEDESPLNVFGYYAPSDGRYCEVEMGGKIRKGDDKIVGSEIKIGAEIGIAGIVKAHIEWVKKQLIKDHPETATNTGYKSAATNTGYQSAATNTGDQSAATNTGDYSAAEVSGKDSVAIATGYDSKARGARGCAIVVAERGEWDGKKYPLLAICAAIVDGETIKENTWYTAKNGKLVEVKE